MIAFVVGFSVFSSASRRKRRERSTTPGLRHTDQNTGADETCIRTLRMVIRGVRRGEDDARFLPPAQSRSKRSRTVALLRRFHRDLSGPVTNREQAGAGPPHPCCNPLCPAAASTAAGYSPRSWSMMIRTMRSLSRFIWPRSVT